MMHCVHFSHKECKPFLEIVNKDVQKKLRFEEYLNAEERNELSFELFVNHKKYFFLFPVFGIIDNCLQSKADRPTIKDLRTELEEFKQSVNTHKD